MINSSQFSIGDAQTWIGEAGNDDKQSPLGKTMLSLAVGSQHLGPKLLKDGIRLVYPEEMPILGTIVSGLTSLMDFSLKMSGYPPPDKVHRQSNVIHLIDRVSGLPFELEKNQTNSSIKERLRLDLASMYGHEHDIIDAYYYRDQLRLKAPDHRSVEGAFGKSVLFYMNRDGRNAKDFLSAPIIDYEASTIQECEDILTSIRDKLKRGPFFKRLWLRGQVQEYSLHRDPEICALFGYGAAGVKQPSLVPSLGRYALNNPGKVDLGYAWMGPGHFWKKPFLVWIMRQNPNWFSNYPEFAERMEVALRNEDDSKFAQLLKEIQQDPRISTDLDDLRQWFFAFFKYGSWIAVLQQYGFKASMLDVTWDLDTAIFFTQAEMVEKKFRLTPPGKDRVIYVFAESREGISFVDMNQLDWGDSEWITSLPARISAQRCGCIIGSTISRQNIYGHLIVARIYLRGNKCITSRTPNEVFPPEQEDLLYKTLRDTRPEPEGLY